MLFETPRSHFHQNVFFPFLWEIYSIWASFLVNLVGLVTPRNSAQMSSLQNFCGCSQQNFISVSSVPCLSSVIVSSSAVTRLPMCPSFHSGQWFSRVTIHQYLLKSFSNTCFLWDPNPGRAKLCSKLSRLLLVPQCWTLEYFVRIWGGQDPILHQDFQTNPFFSLPLSFAYLVVWLW